MLPSWPSALSGSRRQTIKIIHDFSHAPQPVRSEAPFREVDISRSFESPFGQTNKLRFKKRDKQNMNAGPGHPSGGGGGRNRRRRSRRPSNRGGGPGRDRERQPQHGGIYSAPMDHSYRAAMSGNGARPGRQRPGFAPSYAPVDPDPIPQGKEDANSRIFAFVDDLFFMAKIQETARKLNVKVEFNKTEKDLL